MGLSIDARPSLTAWATALGGISYPLLADFEPKGNVLRSLGLYNEESGNGLRGIVVLDKSGMIRFKQIYQGVLPSPSDVLAELDKIRIS